MRRKNQKKINFVGGQCFSPGFSLLGILVSCFVVSLSLIGILGLIASSLRAAEISKDRLVAAGLAQEGIEIVRNIRETNVSWANWYGNFNLNTVYNYRVQYNSSNFLPYSDTPLKINNGLFSYDSGVDSYFYRKVTLRKLSADEIKVLVEVKWRQPNDANWHSLLVEDGLWRWRD